MLTKAGHRKLIKYTLVIPKSFPYYPKGQRGKKLTEYQKNFVKYVNIGSQTELVFHFILSGSFCHIEISWYSLVSSAQKGDSL